VVLQHRRLSFRRPSAAAVGPLAQSTLIDEDDGPAFLSGFFLISGQRFYPSAPTATATSQTITTGSSTYKSHSPRGGFLQVAVSEAPVPSASER
jgi:hypothetical protein